MSGLSKTLKSEDINFFCYNVASKLCSNYYFWKIMITKNLAYTGEIHKYTFYVIVFKAASSKTTKNCSDFVFLITSVLTLCHERIECMGNCDLCFQLIKDTGVKIILFYPVVSTGA